MRYEQSELHPNAPNELFLNSYYVYFFISCQVCPVGNREKIENIFEPMGEYIIYENSIIHLKVEINVDGKYLISYGVCLTS